jgi:hypothetical protein
MLAMRDFPLLTKQFPAELAVRSCISATACERSARQGVAASIIALSSILKRTEAANGIQLLAGRLVDDHVDRLAVRVQQSRGISVTKRPDSPLHLFPASPRAATAAERFASSG